VIAEKKVGSKGGVSPNFCFFSIKPSGDPMKAPYLNSAVQEPEIDLYTTSFSRETLAKNFRRLVFDNL
jgi:hypothetical protein